MLDLCHSGVATHACHIVWPPTKAVLGTQQSMCLLSKHRRLLQEQPGQINPISARSMAIPTPSAAQTRATDSIRFPLGHTQPQLPQLALGLPVADALPESPGVAQATHIASRQTPAMVGCAQPPTIQPPRHSSAPLRADSTRVQLRYVPIPYTLSMLHVVHGSTRSFH